MQMNNKAMKYSSSPFMKGSKEKKIAAGDGIVRQNLGYDDSMLLARVSFEGGATGYVHTHPHSQITYVESGVFDFTVGAETRRLEAGDCAYIPPGETHGTVCIETGVLIDVFSPIREDFLQDTKDEN